MAKKKSPPKDARTIVLSMKGTVAFRDWLARIAEKERISVVQLLEKAAVEYAERRDYEAAPRRTEGR